MPNGNLNPRSSASTNAIQNWIKNDLYGFPLERLTDVISIDTITQRPMMAFPIYSPLILEMLKRSIAPVTIINMYSTRLIIIVIFNDFPVILKDTKNKMMAKSHIEICSTVPPTRFPHLSYWHQYHRSIIFFRVRRICLMIGLYSPRFQLIRHKSQSHRHPSSNEGA